ncbi:anti-sigma factor family protein [Mycobacterium talmoniae]|uniref:Putative zinc-finger domain-containing protein n=1 Tax=Mycobacterium talmoniae TaxID=1858794 RepID=A0A1S1NE44_9MYCO|nr:MULTISPECIES: zf-HC2 domain-containing protein [Mycobacterium]OHU97856.1 hypothetical protein BKN37_21475 [Mycobacterium talmoniae]TDH56945.1 hypothetical protein E2F47_04830 [Mycobacterium eburneum]
MRLGHKYETWDAAYVLGSLSATDRREFEAHLGGCATCRAAVTDLSGMPALLSQLDRNVVASIEEVSDTEAPPAQLRTSLLAAAHSRRHRLHLTWVGTAVAAAAVAVAVFVGGHSVPSAPAPQTTVAALPMAQVHTALLASTVSLSDQGWGTLIELRCVCLAEANAPHDTLAMVVVGRDGSRSRLASWVAHPGHTATPSGSTSLPVERIASVQVVSADSDQVLLQRTL